MFRFLVWHDAHMQILQLEMHLKDQQVVRGALEKALGPDPAPITLENESPMLKVPPFLPNYLISSCLICLQLRNAMFTSSNWRFPSFLLSSFSKSNQPATQLIREVATLELEIKHLEQYLLTLYRKAFEQQQQQQAPTLQSSDANREAPKLSVSSRSAQLDETPKAKAPIRKGDDPMLHYSCPPLRKGRNGAADDSSPSTCPRRTTDFDHGLRSQSALSFRGVCSSRISPTEDSLARALRSCHSQPFSFLEVIVQSQRLFFFYF